MNTKYLFLDIDGTLVGFNGVMPPSALEALKKAHKNGHKLVICTGRQLSQVYPWLLKEVPFDGLILSGGAMVISDGKTVAHHFIERDGLKRLVNYFESHKTAYYLQTQGFLVSKQWCVDRTLALFEKLGYSENDLLTLFGKTVIDDNAENRDDVEKLIYYDSGVDFSDVQNNIGDEFHIVGYSFGNLGNTSGEISKNGVNKASGIDEYLNYCGGNINDAFAFGDAENDLEMFGSVNTGIAMGNACDKLKKLASYVTSDIDDDGLYNAFSHFGLI